MKLTQQVEELIKCQNQTDKWIGEKIDEHRTAIIDIYNRLCTNHKYAQEVEKELCELREVVKQLTQQRERFQHNLMYLEVVEDIITCTETEWDNKTFNNMLVKLVGKDEVYKVFVQTSNAPVIGSKIKFTFNADENKLSKLKIVE